MKRLIGSQTRINTSSPCGATLVAMGRRDVMNTSEIDSDYTVLLPFLSSAQDQFKDNYQYIGSNNGHFQVLNRL
jgi:hypothetical protein